MALQLKHITKTFGNGAAQTEVLKNINFNVNQGEFIILSGASGSGKSTLLNILGGLLSPTSGDVLYNGEHLLSNEVDKTSLRLNDIGFIFQSSHLVPYLTVREQLMIVAKEAGIKRKEAKDKAQRLLTEIGLSHRLDVYPHLLSEGEKQRVAIMRAFMNEPKIILADEPTASLDADRATSVVQMIKAHVQTKNMIGIMITHDKRLFEYADRVIEIEDGKIEL
ncbi:ABC transporter ATP-binding protein [Staphylococcus haemolyticus]|uniref:Putative hemin import ATP-binding protein HrtA n=1 Tax=Staphylococcus haemolyticus TaxID=1283 RepID=A0AB38PCH5_STAHA|nr:MULTISPECIES: ABC transporter ATP-binding protein [Staphylococcus]MCE5036341.1 ABC transporter ATP-binding protein [Staphylococcus haemolyticus]PTK53691.1 hemin ABC transporter ATP-binding protein [Staphylococcus haemolyticus]PTK73011.1 hemin ABC transporter ATP-binding protein [Staphylococcus haemolyticus]PTK81169.1 hemin ABC transporter ATP-binding protein [Staphylococcus haemolyticus]PTK96897.1 hemin ABC transporter ATP-binding protein [Staphylococcus haemolyticus]